MKITYQVNGIPVDILNPWQKKNHVPINLNGLRDGYMEYFYSHSVDWQEYHSTVAYASLVWISKNIFYSFIQQKRLRNLYFLMPLTFRYSARTGSPKMVVLLTVIFILLIRFQLHHKLCSFPFKREGNFEFPPLKKIISNLTLIFLFLDFIFNMTTSKDSLKNGSGC